MMTISDNTDDDDDESGNTDDDDDESGDTDNDHSDLMKG